jgi:phosphohistidine phosphatase
MELCFFRHGIAVDKTDPSVGPDRDRALTAEGIRKTRAAVEGLASLDLSFDRILSSPWLRAIQTARIVGEVLGITKLVEEMDELAGDRSVEDVLHGLLPYASAERLMLVGHQPLLGECVAALLTGGIEMQVDLKKSGACTIEVTGVHSRGSGVLLWHLTPRQLRLMRK